MTKSEPVTYDRKGFFEDWDKVNKNLGERWDKVLKTNPHKDIGHETITDRYFVFSITNRLWELIPHKKGLKLLKYDLYNEATGTGGTMRWLMSKGYNCYGVDISQEVVKLARKNFSKEIPVNKYFKVGDVRKLPFKDNTFDVVFSFGTIEHIRENQKACEEAFRVLKPGGIFITNVNNKINIWGNYLINEATNVLFSKIISYEPSFSPWAQKSWVVNSGFSNIKVDGMITFPHIFRYLDFVAEWKRFPKILKLIIEFLILKPWIWFSKITDEIFFMRYLGMHTSCSGIKPKR